MIYHLLDEPFSIRTGMAISRVVANMMRSDEASCVVCPAADDTWELPQSRTLIIRRLSLLTWTIKGSKMRGWRYLPRPLRHRLIRWLLAPVLQKMKYGDIAWCHNWPYVGEALERPVHQHGAKLIYHAHNSLASYAGRSLFRLFAPDALIFNSQAMRREALKLLPNLKNTYTVHNGADETLFHPRVDSALVPGSCPVILFVGRLVPVKGVHVLVEAMEILQKRGVTALCKIVGSKHAGQGGWESSYVKSLHSRCSSNVQFEGFRTNKEIAEEYRRADIFCCPSVWQEPFGLVNIEAMATGLPVVASRVGGIPEIAAEGGVILVEPNSAEQLADALQRLAENRNLRMALGARGLASFRRRFTTNAVMRQCNEVVEHLRQAEVGV